MIDSDGTMPYICDEPHSSDISKFHNLVDTICQEAEISSENTGSLYSEDRKEFLDAVKYRAIVEMKYSGNPANGLASFMGDIDKYRGDTPLYTSKQLSILMSTAMVHSSNLFDMIRWINGCN